MNVKKIYNEKVKLSDEQLFEDIDFTVYNEETKSRLQGYQPVIILPGLQIGTHRSFIDYCKWIAKCWKVKKVKIYSHTWMHKTNDPWSAKLELICKDEPLLAYKVIKERYSDEKLYHFLTSIKVNLGGKDTGSIDSQFLKRFIVFYSMMRIYEEFLINLPKETYIFKFRACYYFPEDFRPDIFDRIWRAKTKLGPDTFREKYHFTDDLDIVFSQVNAPDVLGENLFYTSLQSFTNIFGKSRIELIGKLTEVLDTIESRLEHSKKYTATNVDDKMYTFAVFPYSGAILLYHLVKNFSPLLLTDGLAIRNFDFNSKWSNPIVNIQNGKIFTYLGPDGLKTHQAKLDDYIISYNTKSYV